MSRKLQIRQKKPWIGATSAIFFGGLGCFYTDWRYGMIGSIIWGIALTSVDAAGFWPTFLVQVGLGIGAFKICEARNHTLAKQADDESLVQNTPEAAIAAAAQPASSTSSPVRKAVKFASILVLVDAFFLNQGIFSALVAVIAIACLPWAAWAGARGNKRLFRMRMAQIGIVLAGCLTVFASNWYQNHSADQKAIDLGNACLAYHAKYNRYPKRLEELVPEFVAEIPAAKQTFISRDFSYCFSGSGEPEIYYIEIPPFGRRFYHIETGRWGYLD
ncbi:MAG TPA: hypothetical protein VF011_10195 [Terriglobales bacterium]